MSVKIITPPGEGTLQILNAPYQRTYRVSGPEENMAGDVPDRHLLKPWSGDRCAKIHEQKSVTQHRDKRMLGVEAENLSGLIDLTLQRVEELVLISESKVIKISVANKHLARKRVRRLSCRGRLRISLQAWRERKILPGTTRRW